MIFRKTENIKIKKLRKYFTGDFKLCRVKVKTYWFLFVPVASSQKIITLLDS